MDKVTITGHILNFVGLFADVMMCLLPWMILAAVHAVKKSVDDASAHRTFEAQKILSALNTLHGDLYALANGGDEEETVEE